MEQIPHDFAYCYAVEVPRYVYVPEHDDFDAGLGLNAEATEPRHLQFPLFDNVLYKVEYLGKFY